MPPRREVTTGLRPEPFQPVTAPVSTFVQPAQSGLKDLARALAPASATLRQFSSDLADQQKEQDVAKAQSDVQRMAASNKSYTDAIRDGSIPPGASPWYRFAAREAYGRLEASKFTSSLLGDVDQILTESGGTADFDQVVAQRVQAAGASQQDSAYQQGFFRNLENQLSSARSSFEARKSQIMEKSATDTMSATMYEGLRNALLTNGDLHDPANRTALIAPLRNEGLRMMTVNPRAGQSVNEAMVSAIVGLAQEQTDPSLLSLADDIVLPSGGHLSSTVAFRDAKGKALSEIAQRQNILDRAKERQVEDRTDQIYNEILTHAGDGTPPDWAGYQQEMRSFGGEGLQALNQLQARIGATDNVDDPAVEQALTRSILFNDGTTTPRTIADYIGRGLSPQGASRMAGLLATTDRRMNEMPPRWHQALDDGHTQVIRLARESIPGFTVLGTPSALLAKRELDFSLQFSQDFQHYYDTNKTADGSAIQHWVNTWVAHKRVAQASTPPDPNGPKPAAPLAKDAVTALLNRVEAEIHANGPLQDFSSGLRRDLTAAGVPRTVRSKAEIQAYLTTPQQPTP